MPGGGVYRIDPPPIQPRRYAPIPDQGDQPPRWSSAAFAAIVERWQPPPPMPQQRLKFVVQSSATVVSTDCIVPITIVDDSAVGGLTWINPSQAGDSDNLYASCSGAASSHYLKATDLESPVPAGAEIVGVVVKVEKKWNGVGVAPVDSVVSLVVGGVVVGDNKASTDNWPTTDTVSTYGSEFNTWDLALTAADVNATDFGVVISTQNQSSIGDVASVDHICIQIYYLATVDEPPRDQPWRRFLMPSMHWPIGWREQQRQIQIAPEAPGDEPPRNQPWRQFRTVVEHWPVGWFPPARPPLYSPESVVVVADFPPPLNIAISQSVIELWWRPPVRSLIFDNPPVVPDPGYDVPTLKGGMNPYAPWHWVRDVRGNTYLANGIDRPQVWDGRSTTTRNWGIDAATTAPTVALGSAGALTGDYYYHYAWVNSATGVVSSPSAISSVIAATSDRIDISGVPASNTDPQVTHWRLFRNTAGQTTTFYKVADIAIGTTTYTDNITDATITANDIMDDDNDPPSSWQCYVAFYKGRMHIYGGRIEKEGTVTATNGSAAIVGSGTDFKPSHVGQAFMVPGDTTQYEVLSVTDVTHLTLTANYGGSTGGSKAYKLFMSEDRAQWNWSKAGEEEYFPAANSANVAENDDDEPTGLFIVGSQLFASKRRHVYRLLHDQDPATDGGIFEALKHRGLVNQRSVVVIGPEAFLFDEFGAYQFDGGSTATPIDFAINRLIQPSTEPLADRVNWAYREKFHAIWDPKRDRVLFFVCLGSDTEPKNALVYERKRQRWTIEEYRVGITSSSLQRDSSNRLRAWVGDENGCVWALGISAGIDGAPASASGTLRGTVTSATSTTLSDSTATFYTTGDKLIGVPVYNVTTGEWRIISSNSGTVLTLSSAWSVTPSVGDVYRVGAIELQLRTKWQDLGDGVTKSFKKVRVYFQPTSTDYTVGVKVYYDFSSTAFLQWSSQIHANRGDGLEVPSTAASDGIVLVHMKPDNADGYVEIPIGLKYARWIRLEFLMIDTERKPALLGWDLVADAVPGGTRGGR